VSTASSFQNQITLSVHNFTEIQLVVSGTRHLNQPINEQ